MATCSLPVKTSDRNIQCQRPSLFSIDENCKKKVYYPWKALAKYLQDSAYDQMSAIFVKTQP